MAEQIKHTYDVALEGYFEPGRFQIIFATDGGLIDGRTAEEHVRWWARHRAEKILRQRQADDEIDHEEVALALSQLPEPQFEAMGAEAIGE